MDMQITFPGGKRVDAAFGDFVVKTDQPIAGGGDGSAPEPFALFLASLATCAGIYVLGFCRARSIPTDGIRLTQRTINDEAGHLARIELEVHVPPEFPANYRDAVARAAAACKVKKAIMHPPEMVVTTRVTDEAEEKCA
jgi:putative redox protein